MRGILDLRSRGLSTWDLDALGQREQSRSQRYSVSSCVVVFDFSKAARPEKKGRTLLHTLIRRVRSADRIGRLGNERIGLFMPATGPAGADKVVRDVLEGWRREEAPFCTVKCYPGSAEIGLAPVGAR